MGRGKDPMSNDLIGTLEFLADLHASGKSYNTINVHHSMLSRTLGSVEGFPLGCHPLVVDLLRGCYNLNTPKPKYSATWDPDQIMPFVKSLGENHLLPLSVLAGKTVTLIALASLMRVSEIAAIDLNTVVFF
jgi:hypothetical protein